MSPREAVTQAFVDGLPSCSLLSWHVATCAVTLKPTREAQQTRNVG
jgi:hypothetical protein